MVVGTVFAVAACGEQEDVITLDTASFLRTQYVEGQELDLANGVLKITKNGTPVELALNAEGVTVSGYEKNKVGKQQLTVTYEGQEIQVSVTVVSRMVAEGIVDEYFVGDEFNKEKGRIRIARDNGTSFSVNLNDQALTISGYDSQQAGELTLTAEYKKGSESYTDTFTVNVYDIEEVVLTRPNKLGYKSHETELDLAGSYLTVKGGTLSKTVAITEDMTKGFAPSAATPENIEGNPLKQKVIVSYPGYDKELSFTLNVTYSKVSMFKALLGDLIQLDWTGESAPAISEELGETAIEAAGIFLTLTNAEKKFVTAEESAAVIKAATVYSYSLWETAAQGYEDTFKMAEEGLYLLCESYEGVKEDYRRLNEEEATLFTQGELLSKMKENYAAELVIGETTVEEYLASVYNPADVKSALPIFKYMLDLYEAISAIGDEWNADMLTANGTAIEGVVETISSSAYASRDYTFIYQTVSDWREKNDYFDIIYTYLYQTENDEAMGKIKNIYLPSKLETIYLDVTDAISMLVAIANKQLIDTTELMYVYNEMVNLSEEIAESGSEMQKALYSSLTFDGLLFNANGSASVTFEELISFIRTTEGGILYHQNSMVDNETFNSLWNQYYTILGRYFLTDGNSTSTFASEIEEMLRTFVNASPTEQRGFLSSINVNYRSGSPLHALSIKNNTVYSTFAYLIATHYSSLLSEDAMAVFADLLIALEDYTLRYFKISTGEGETSDYGAKPFLDGMKAVTTGFNGLSGTDKEAFKTHLGYFLEKYQALTVRYEDSVTHPALSTIPTEWVPVFEELKEALLDANDAQRLISQSGVSAYAAYISAYEEVLRIVNVIMAAPKEVLNIYYHEEYPIFTDEEWSLDYTVNYFRTFYMTYMTKLTIMREGISTPLLDVYKEYNLAPFMLEARYVMLTYIAYDSDVAQNYTDTDAVLDAMRAFRALGAEKQSLFRALDGKAATYYDGLKFFFKEVLGEQAYELALKLIEIEKAYTDYSLNPDGKNSKDETYLSIIQKLYGEISQMVSSLEGDAGYNSYLREMYEYYHEKCKDL